MKHCWKHKLKKTSGISLLEVLLSLLVIVAVGLMATRYFQEAGERSRLMQAVDQVRQLVDVSYRYIEMEADGSTLSLAKLKDNDMWPRFSKPLWPRSELSVYSSQYGVAVSMTAVPHDSCMALQEYLLNSVNHQAQGAEAMRCDQCQMVDAHQASRPSICRFHANFK